MPPVDAKYRLSDERFVPRGAEVNIVVIGDTFTGKTALAINYIYNKFEENPEQSSHISVQDIYKAERNIYQAKLKVNIQDTPGDDVLQLHVNKRKEYIKWAHVVMICFSVDQLDNSEDNVKRWLLEVRDVDL